METSLSDNKISEALSTVGQFFSDTIPPVHAAESVGILMTQPPQLMASEIITWISRQNQIQGRNASVADYLFHAVCKLQYIAHLQLISGQLLAPYLDRVKNLLLDYCPTEDRQLLNENFGHIEMSDMVQAVPLNLIYRQKSSNEPESGAWGGPISQQSRDRRLSILWSRLKSEVGQPGLPAGMENREELVPHLIATAAANAHSGEELRKFQENLKSLGIDSGTDQIFRTLSHSLPGWMVSTTGADAVESHNPAIEAMSKIIHLAEDYREGCKRFEDMVQAAIEQFNTGSLARAATMLDLALGIASEGNLDPLVVANVRKTAHTSLDMNRLRDLVKERDKHRLLRKVLNFFDEFEVQNILDSLQHENKRDRRRMLLGILDVYGGTARKIAFTRLKELLAVTDVATDWHFARNLVCILNGTPGNGEVPFEEEMELIARLLEPSQPVALVKEAIKYAGQIKSARSEDLLIRTANELEKTVCEHAAPAKEAAQKISLLDRTIFALAHYGTPKACRIVVNHGVSGLDELGDTAARLTYLSSQDLTADSESLASLIRFLKSRTPRKLLGMTIGKNDQSLFHAIKALSSTPAPMVRQVLREIATQFPETKFGETAAHTLRGFEASDKPGSPQSRMMTGDLDLFGLPDLLQQLSREQLNGTLTVKDANGNPVGTFSLLAERIQNCSAGRLEGVEAAYQLLEKPVEGTFVFQGRNKSEFPEQPDKQRFPDLDSILSEGMRRYDELQKSSHDCARSCPA